jgi:hypothetical protein
LLNEDGVVMWANSPVFRVVVLIGIILLVISKEAIELDALFEVLDSFEASNMLEEIEISEHVDACSDKSVPVDTLDLNIGVILLELESDGLTKVDVWSLNSMHVFTCHFELVKIEVFWEHLHFFFIIIKYV